MNKILYFPTSPKAITMEELYQRGIVPEYDEQKQCYYFEHPVTDEELTPCIQDLREFEKYLNEHPEVLEAMEELEQGDIEEDIKKAA